MRLVEYDINKIKSVRNHYKISANLKLLTEFVESGMECMKVEGWTTKTASICASSLNLSAKRYKIGGVRAMSTKGEVFLIKVDQK